ncbi:MAG: cell wall biosynthesis protein [Methanobrevibacter sp.]|nr:cell wall biosynthesis protein [Methanobrevibacter sp.]
MNYEIYLTAFIPSLVLTGLLSMLLRHLGKRNYLGIFSNLYQSVRGGTPRALGVVPYLLLGIFLPPGFNDLVLIIGFFALIDDVIGRRKISNFQMEWGQLLRGIGMIAVMIIGFPLFGYASILIALLIQPINISDMQPGTTCSVVIIMSILSILPVLLMSIVGMNFTIEFQYYIPLIVLVVCLGYAPLDYAGKIMMGEVGNHSFAIALGLCFYVTGGFWWTLFLFIVTTSLIAFIRKNNLKEFFANNLKISNPAPGDYFMDVLTGGGLGDGLRKIFLGKRQISVKRPLLKFLGFRRLLFNPFALEHKKYISKKLKSNILTKKQ